MALQFGRSAFIKYGKESTYGTPASVTIQNRLTSISLSRSQERERTTSLSQSNAGFAMSTFDGFEQAGGTIEMPFFYKGQGLLLEVACGATVATTGAGPTYTHVFEPRSLTSSPTLDSLTIEVQRGTGSSEKFEGCMVSAFSFSCEAGGEAAASVEIIAETASARAGSVAPPSFGNGPQIFHHQVTAAGLDYNSVNYKVRSFEIAVDNKLERVNNLGSKLTGQPQISDVREVTITATLDLEDNNLYNAQLDGTQSDVSLTFSDGTNSLSFLLRNAKVMDYSDDINSFGRIERSVTFFGLADSSDPAFKITLTNDDATGLGN